MDLKPGEFFIGVIDFFGILVPGSVCIFLERQWFHNILGNPFDKNEHWMWAAFLIGAYVLGHFLLGLGVPFNRLLWVFFRKDCDAYYQDVKDKIEVPPDPCENGHNGFIDSLRSLWKKTSDERAKFFYRAYAFVRLKDASALAEMDRQMADYKLFRSLMLVFAIDFGRCLLQSPKVPGRTAFSGVLCVLAFWRFLFLLNWTYRITFEYYALLKSNGKPDTLDV